MTIEQGLAAWKEYQQVNSQKISSWEAKSEDDKRELYDAIKYAAESLRDVVGTQDKKVNRYESMLQKHKDHVMRQMGKLDQYDKCISENLSKIDINCSKIQE